MSVAARQLLLLVLVAIFATQTWLVYSDPAGRRDALSPEARRGLDIWREYNCQSCHQIYGFGGFLGPDLTNAVGALSSERLDSILTEGAGQMPAFGLDAEERRAVRVLLEELDATGVSQPKLGEAVLPAELLRQLSETPEPLPDDIARGREIVLAQNCISCHLPNQESLHRSTDLTTLVTSVEPARMLEILRDGIPEKAMPRLGLSDADGEAVRAFLTWMRDNGEEIRGRFENLPTSTELDLSKVPWFEYP